MKSGEDDTPQQQQEEGDAETGGKKKCSSKSDSLFSLSDSGRTAHRCGSKSGAVYQECPIKPEKFPRNFFNLWELWVKHYKSVMNANGWSDMQLIEALPACLTSWAVEEFETVPRHFAQKVLGEKNPGLTRY